MSDDDSKDNEIRARPSSPAHPPDPPQSLSDDTTNDESAPELDPGSTPLPPSGHEPVMPVETIAWLRPAPGAVIVDCTTGRGGHSRLLAQHLGANGLLLCIDADSRNLEFARAQLAGVQAPVRFFNANFGELREVLAAAGVQQVDGILADLGVSTNQLFDAQYGLSFRESMPLDMRLDSAGRSDRRRYGQHLREEDLANVLYQLAQERYSRRIARKIVQARQVEPIKTTDRLAELVRSAVAFRGGAPARIDPATRTFLALRMAVNQEPENLASLLKEGPAVSEATRTDGSDQFSIDGRPHGEAGVSVGGADRATEGADQKAPLPHSPRSRPEPPLTFGKAPRRGKVVTRSSHAPPRRAAPTGDIC